MIHFHCDVDNLWVYEAEYGRREQAQLYGHVYETALPRLCDLLDEAGARATFFIIGQDLQLPACRQFCESAAKRGHRFANHSFSHPADFGRRSLAEKERELRQTDANLREVTNQEVVGFRGPGYWIDQETIEILIQLGYRYDSTVLPGPATTLMAIYSIISGQRLRGKAFGTHMLASRKPSRLHSKRDPQRYVVEIPIATATALRLPTHSTILFMMRTFGMRYFRRIAPWIQLESEPSSFLFHAVDLADVPVQNQMRHVKALQMPLAERTSAIREILATLAPANAQTTEQYLETGGIAPLRAAAA